MSDKLSLLAGQRREEIIKAFDGILIWHDSHFKSQIQVRKQSGWRCLITQNSLRQATFELVNNLKVTELYANISPYDKQDKKIFQTHNTPQDVQLILNKVNVLSSAVLAIGGSNRDIHFLQCRMPENDFSFFFGTDECFKIISKDKMLAHQWSSEPDLTDTQDDLDWVARRLAEVHDYDELSEGEWQTFTWGLGEYLELNNLTLEQYQRQKGWIP